MYYMKMTFTSIKKIEVTEDSIDEITSPIWSYLGSLHRSGQIYNDNLIHKDGIFYAYFLMPEFDSLDKKYCDEYTLNDLVKVKELFKLNIEHLGINTESNSCCDCKQPT